MEFPELKKQGGAQAEQWRPHAILVEDKASGQSRVQELATATGFPVLPVNVDADKVTRASTVTPFFERGKVFFPEGAGWLPDLEDELAAFPGGVHDDCVDSVSQALNYLRGENRDVFGFVDFLKGLASGEIADPTRSTSALERVQPRQEKISEDATTCPACGSDLLRTLAWGEKRCQQFGKQFGTRFRPGLPAGSFRRARA